MAAHLAVRSAALKDTSTAVLLAATWVGLMDSSLVVHLAVYWAALMEQSWAAHSVAYWAGTKEAWLVGLWDWKWAVLLFHLRRLYGWST